MVFLLLSINVVNYINSFSNVLVWFGLVFFMAVPVACGIFLARDSTCTTAATQVIAVVTMPDP